MDLNADKEESILMQNEYNKLFIQKYELERVKIKLESEIDHLMREKESREK